jgi:hypothetical protein
MRTTPTGHDLSCATGLVQRGCARWLSERGSRDPYRHLKVVDAGDLTKFHAFGLPLRPGHSEGVLFRFRCQWTGVGSLQCAPAVEGVKSVPPMGRCAPRRLRASVCLLGSAPGRRLRWPTLAGWCRRCASGERLTEASVGEGRSDRAASERLALHFRG